VIWRQHGPLKRWYPITKLHELNFHNIFYGDVKTYLSTDITELQKRRKRTNFLVEFQVLYIGIKRIMLLLRTPHIKIRRVMQREAEQHNSGALPPVHELFKRPSCMYVCMYVCMCVCVCVHACAIIFRSQFALPTPRLLSFKPVI
jgi:hypothetical protein